MLYLWEIEKVVNLKVGLVFETSCLYFGDQLHRISFCNNLVCAGDNILHFGDHLHRISFCNKLVRAERKTTYT